MELVAVAALDDARVIGSGETVPWDIPAETRRYRERVDGDPCVLGRRTFEQMREDLPGTHQVVLSRSRTSFDAPTAHHAAGVDAALAALADIGGETAYVLGGGAVYELFQPHLDRMVLSRVPGEHDGDVRYPEWDDDDWALVAETPFEEGYVLEEWERRAGGR